jgi:exopolyphosphatase / guanosine-5'-triphosphate,3'-diphosphate pyrophosphatase
MDQMCSASTASTVVPRWEWRTFAKSLKALEASIPAAACALLRPSEEIYLLNLRGPHNAKIRGGILDIKQLQIVNAEGLELWRPAFKGAFPLSQAKLQDAFAAWALPQPQFSGEAYTLERFLEEIAVCSADLRITHVCKNRRGFSLGGCTAEFVDVIVNGISCESFCLEQEDPSLITKILKQLGLASRANINYPEGLKRALGISPIGMAIVG